MKPRELIKTATLESDGAFWYTPAAQCDKHMARVFRRLAEGQMIFLAGLDLKHWCCAEASARYIRQQLYA